MTDERGQGSWRTRRRSSTMPRNAVWYHALSARVGGGITYQAAVLPALARRLAERGVPLVVLRGGAPTVSFDAMQASIPDGVSVKPFPSSDRSYVHRLVVDQVLVPWRAWRDGAAVLACMASHAPILAATPKIVLLRNTIYFDRELQAMSTPIRRWRLRIERVLVIAGAFRARTVLYPSASMQSLVEASIPRLLRRRFSARGVVNGYGVSDDFLAARARRTDADRADAPVFLVPSSATTQKNLGLVVDALVMAVKSRVDVVVELTCTLADLPGALADRVRASGLVESGRLRLVGTLPRDEVRERLVAVDGCLLPSLTESFCHPAVEALAVGCPLICADRPWARDICGDGALFVPAHDPAALVEVWRSWRSGGTRAVAQLAESEVAARFCWTRHVDVLDRVLGDAAASRRGR